MVVSVQRPLAVGHLLKEGGERLQINSLDASPDGKRLATAGADAHVKIWDLEVLLGPAEDAPLLLCTIAELENIVQCVRWSPDGSFLATGDDGALVKLWRPRPSGAMPRGSFVESAQNVEHWRCIVTFRGHTMDCTSLSWSPDAGLLASASVDNTVRVWEVEAAYRSRELATIETQARAVLRGHTGWVKGVAWDPVGRYVASVSDDKSVIVWRCSDWKLESRVEEPFAETTCATMRRQLDWSPDGVALCVSHAYDTPQHVAYVMERNKWADREGALRLVGHHKPVSVCRFSPVLYRSKRRQSPSTLVAIACEKATLTLWVPGRSSPILVCKGMFKQQVLDMCWTRDGRTLFLCSAGGMVSFVRCEDLEAHPHVGQPLGRAQADELLQELYGDEEMRQSEPMLAETPLQHRMETAAGAPAGAEKAAPPAAVLPAAASSSSSSSSAAAASASGGATMAGEGAAEQVETRTSDGKRRIAPVSLVQGGAPTVNVLQPRRAGAESPAVNLLRPRKVARTGPGGASAATTSNALDQRLSGPQKVNAAGAAGAAATSAAALALGAPRPASGSAGGSRLAPTVVVAKQAVGLGTRVLRPARCLRAHRVCVMQEGRDAKWAAVRCGKRRGGSAGPRDLESVVELQHNGARCWDTLVEGRVSALAGNHRFVAAATKGGELLLFATQSGRMLLPALQLPCGIACLAAAPGDSPYLVCVTCDARMRLWDVDRMVALVTNVEVDPLALLLRPAKEGAAPQALRLEAGISMAGLARRSRNPRNKPPSGEAAGGDDDDSEQSEWSDDEGDAGRGGKGGITRGGAQTTVPAARLSVTTNGTPLLLVSRPAAEEGEDDTQDQVAQGALEAAPSGELSAAFAYSLSMKAWARVADARRFLQSDFFSSVQVGGQARRPESDTVDVGGLDAGILAALQEAVAAAGVQVGSRASAQAAELAAAPPNARLSVVHLESQLGSAALLRTPEEYRQWLMQYVRRLTDDGDALRLRALCMELAGPRERAKSNLVANLRQELGSADVVHSESGQAWQPKAMGLLEKRELLEQILPVVARNRRLQSVVHEFATTSSSV